MEFVHQPVKVLASCTLGTHSCCINYLFSPESLCKNGIRTVAVILLFAIWVSLCQYNIGSIAIILLFAIWVSLGKYDIRSIAIIFLFAIRGALG